MGADQELDANADRFSGFAGLYDAVRPDPPADLAEVLTAYVGGRADVVVDLGCGTGLSSRWASAWAGSVVGVEPSDDMRRAAQEQPRPNLRYVEGFGHDAGLPNGSADVVVAVQAFHWMEPASTLTEVARLLRPGGLFAAIDCDWPPTVGSSEAEAAWTRCQDHLRALEIRLAAGATVDELRRTPISERSDAGTDRHRRLARGVRSWPKSDHLANLERSGAFAWCHEVVAHRLDTGNAERFVELLRSQGDYQSLVRAGLEDETLGVEDLRRVAQRQLGPSPRPWIFSYRTRLGVTRRC